MNKKKITGLLLTGAMVMSTVAPMSVHAAPGTQKTQEVPVSYTAGTIIPDPEAPNNPKWGVALPTAVSFNDALKTADAGVSLQKLGGATAYETGLSVEVKVKSANGYTVNDGDTVDADKVAYGLTYGTTTVNSGTSETLIATLAADNESVTGTAELTGTATSTKEHTDKLTYLIQRQ